MRTPSGLHLSEDINARRNRMIAWWAKADKMAQRLEKELKSMDERLEVVFVDPESAKLDPSERGMGVVPGRWHVVRRNPDTVDSWFPIMGPASEYRDPELKVAEDMKKADLWRPGALKELRDHQAKQIAEKEKKKELEKEQRRDEMAVAARAAKRMNGDAGMYRDHSRHGELSSYAKKAREAEKKKLILP